MDMILKGKEQELYATRSNVSPTVIVKLKKSFYENSFWTFPFYFLLY
jgi:hypothetical protein